MSKNITCIWLVMINDHHTEILYTQVEIKSFLFILDLFSLRAMKELVLLQTDKIANFGFLFRVLISFSFIK